MKYILTDIEGTTTSISFVHDVLFPYSLLNIEKFVLDNIDLEHVKSSLNEIIEVSSIEDKINILLTWIKEDRKHPVLKKIQGLIWEQGYHSGELKAHLYEDVPDAFKTWLEAGFKIGIYSSGSVHAQKLLFGHSIYNDLNSFISNYFDTSVGHKREVESYSEIVKRLNLKPEEIIFLSDISEELDAARNAGMKTIQLLRNEKVSVGNHATARSFLEIKINEF